MTISQTHQTLAVTAAVCAVVRQAAVQAVQPVNPTLRQTLIIISKTLAPVLPAYTSLLYAIIITV